jgi:2-dehydropantoate 2-reductase
MKITVVGTGGVGGFFGAKLFASGQDVRFLARGNHLKAMQQSGLTVHAPDGDMHVPADRFAETPSSENPADVVFFCVKTYDTTAAARTMGPLLSKETLVISLQNGVESEQALQRLVETGTVYSGIAYVYSTITAADPITEMGNPRKILFGRLSSSPANERAWAVVDTLVQGGIDAEYCPDIRPALWKKFIFIAAVGGMTAVTRLTLHEILAVPRISALLAAAMRETEAVARASGIPLEPGYVDGVLEKLSRYPNETRSSLHFDLTHEKPLEIEALSGAVVRYGTHLGIPTPVHEFLYATLLPHHERHLRLRGGT